MSHLRDKLVLTGFLATLVLAPAVPGLAQTAAVPEVQAEVVDVGNTLCPITGKKVNPKATAVYEGKRYAFCCKNCVAKFEKDPEKYLTELE